MNGKKAKALRRQAEQLTVGMLKAIYNKIMCHGFRFIPEHFNSKGMTVNAKFIKAGDWKPQLLIHACTRNIYKLLKGQGKINLAVIPKKA